jgi:hypothetical protein
LTPTGVSGSQRPSKSSTPNPHGYAKESNQLSWFKFIGRILGKALYQGILVNVKFADFFLAKVSSILEYPFARFRPSD